MTNVVKKGANRASANARTRKAAQRTPLPPRGATSGHGKETRAAVIRDELESRVKFDVPGAEDAELPVDAHPRAKALAGLAVLSGWTAEVTAVGVESGVVARRGDEFLRISWIDGKFKPWAGYRFGSGSEQRVQNAKGAERLLARPAGEALTQESARSTARIVATARSKPAGRNLPDLGSMTDEALLAHLGSGCTITWTNSISGEPEQERVFPYASSMRVSSGTNGRRIVTFPAYAGKVKVNGEFKEMPGQIRSVAISSITAIR